MESYEDSMVLFIQFIVFRRADKVFWLYKS